MVQLILEFSYQVYIINLVSAITLYMQLSLRIYTLDMQVIQSGTQMTDMTQSIAVKQEIASAY